MQQQRQRQLASGRVGWGHAHRVGLHPAEKLWLGTQHVGLGDSLPQLDRGDVAQANALTDGDVSQFSLAVLWDQLADRLTTDEPVVRGTSVVLDAVGSKCASVFA